jgi:prolyl oligopeptidase
VKLAGLVSTQLEALSTDSARVPISITYSSAALRNGKLDGTAPLLVDSYSAFGSTTDPAFMPIIQAWVQLGGVYAHVHARGGGELGELWHTSAMREHKHRTIEDVIAAIETLIAQRYTSAGRVTLTGTSFGANIPGQVMLERPDLLGAALYEVGQPDEIRGARLDPTAARNIAEIGDLDTQDGVQSMMKASPYYQVPARVTLPAVLVHSASDDYNFGTQMLPAKFIARLQRANSGTRPVLWLQTGGGHRDLFGLGPEWAAKALSFALWQSGVSGFQPAGR